MPEDKNNPNGTGADTTWNPAPASDTPPAWTDPDKKGDDNKWGNPSDVVPSRRLKEEADKRREAENKVKEYETKEAEREKKNLEKQGKFKELLDTANQEIETLKGKTKTIDEYDKAMETLVSTELEAIKTSLGEEKYKKIETLLDLPNKTALEKLQTLPKIKELVSDFVEKKPDPKWGQGIPPHDTSTYDKAKSQGDFNWMLSSIIETAIKK